LRRPWRASPTPDCDSESVQRIAGNLSMSDGSRLELGGGQSATLPFEPFPALKGDDVAVLASGNVELVVALRLVDGSVLARRAGCVR
jgi:hypothetical protein